MIFTKTTVKFAHIAPAGFRILGALELVSRTLQVDLTISAGTDGLHAKNSRHYTGEAYDVRTRGIDAPMLQAIIEMLKLELGPRFTVLYEDPGTANQHLHLQPLKGSTYSES
jgi:hypothetical protein